MTISTQLLSLPTNSDGTVCQFPGAASRAQLGEAWYTNQHPQTNKILILTVHPLLHRFLNQGWGLGFDPSQLRLPNISDFKGITGDRIYDHAVSLISPDTLWTAHDRVVQWYLSHEALSIALGFCFWISVFHYVSERITGNMSQVDRMWAFLPWLYSLHFTFQPAFSEHGLSTKAFSWTGLSKQGNFLDAIVPDGVEPRMFLIFLLQTLWAGRITFNTVRRGIWKPWEEDYRWPLLRKDMPKWQIQIFALTFVAFIQNILLMATALPQYLLLTARTKEHPTHPPAPIGWPDAVLAAIFVGILIVEQIADSQQQAYQNWKRSPKAISVAGKTDKQLAVDRAKLQRGFRTDGLWAWSRHPNFCMEQSHWYILYLFTLRATMPASVPKTLSSATQNTLLHLVSGKSANFGKLFDLYKEAAPHFINYSLIGAVAMQLLFEGSGPYTEQISAAKYPLYKEYQKRVAMFWPGMTILKAIGLGLSGQLKSVNSKVFGTATSPAQKQKKK